ncbi:LysR family transcriptional regulator [Pusillimonas sp.]|uniref:LysR family transcriptional regulator n=1 Tax=Pusillimonas sp. TaxID=3040095 RepID=UPI0037C9DB50
MPDTAQHPAHDLNFLYLVDALYREGSVSGAARRLNLTQPAVSHALGRLRGRFGDQLFVRSGAGMTPTPLGERVALGASKALALIQTDILNEPMFDPRVAERRFNVGMTDMGGSVILPKVLQMLDREAPGITVRPKVATSSEIGQMLENGSVDVAWGYFGHLGPSLYQQSLFRRALIGIRRKSRRHEPMTLQTFVDTPHVIASATAVTNELLQQRLKERGHTLKIALECPYVLAVPAIVAGTSCIATVPDELAEVFQRLADIETFELPLPMPDFTVKQHWHARFNDDAGHRWFRAKVFEYVSDAEGNVEDLPSKKNGA